MRKELNEKELRKRINETFKVFPINKLKESLRKNYEPKKNVVGAFRNLNENGSIIEFPAFRDVLIKYKTPKEIENAIFEKSKINRRFINDFSNMGKGGRRGKSIEWRLYLDAETILFKPREVLEKYNLNIDEIEFFNLLERTCKELKADPDSKSSLGGNLDKAVNWSLSRLIDIFEKFYEYFDFDNPNHMKILLMIDKALLARYGIFDFEIKKDKGKQITERSIYQKIEMVRAHAYGKKGKKNQKIYLYKKLYYLPWLAYMIDLTITEWITGRLRKCQIRKYLDKIKPLMDELPFETRQELIENLYPKALST